MTLSWKQNKMSKTTYVMLASVTCYCSICSHRLYSSCASEHNITLRHKCNACFFSVCISTRGASTLVWYCNGVCDIIYREELSSHYSQIILQSSFLLQLMEFWIAEFHLFHYTHIHYVVCLQKSHDIQVQCWLLI